MRDADVRVALRDRIPARSRAPHYLLVPEVQIRELRVRIDLLEISSRLTAWEIKSDVDTLRRLPAQIAGYEAAAERMNLVVGQRHEQAACSALPSWWGLWRATWVDGAVQVEPLRLPQVNPNFKVAVAAVFLSRWELAWELKSLGVPRLSTLPVDELRAVFVERLGARRSMDIIRRRMMLRQDWADRALASRLPRTADPITAASI